MNTKVNKVTKDHFRQAALEIGKNGENDTLPYGVDAKFIKDKADDLSEICFNLFKHINGKNKKEEVKKFIKGLDLKSELLLVPAGPNGFRIVTKINLFWNIYLNGIGLCIAEANEKNRSKRVHSYRLKGEHPNFFDREKSWRAYKESTLNDPEMLHEEGMVVQTDISSFYERIYHHRLENCISDLFPSDSNLAVQVDRIINKLSHGKSFGLPVGGQCARILAEVMMTPIDQTLTNKNLVWHRYVDDFTIICKSHSDAYKALSILSNSLAVYGLSLNRTKTTILSKKHYKDYVDVQLDSKDESSIALRELDVNFDPYSDTAESDYITIKSNLEKINIGFLLDLEAKKSQPDNFIIAQISRAAKFQDINDAGKTCATLLNSENLNSFRSSWSKIMRGIYKVRENIVFKDLFGIIDKLLDEIPIKNPHLLQPEANILHYLPLIRFAKNNNRSQLVLSIYDERTSEAVKCACIDCWGAWEDRNQFLFLRNKWENLGAEEKRMLWLAANKLGDEGIHAKSQLGDVVYNDWRLGFEEELNSSLTFARIYKEWSKDVV